MKRCIIPNPLVALMFEKASQNTTGHPLGYASGIRLPIVFAFLLLMGVPVSQAQTQGMGAFTVEPLGGFYYQDVDFSQTKLTENAFIIFLALERVRVHATHYRLWK